MALLRSRFERRGVAGVSVHRLRSILDSSCK